MIPGGAAVDDFLTIDCLFLVAHGAK